MEGLSIVLKHSNEILVFVEGHKHSLIEAYCNVGSRGGRKDFNWPLNEGGSNEKCGEENEDDSYELHFRIKYKEHEMEHLFIYLLKFYRTSNSTVLGTHGNFSGNKFLKVYFFCFLSPG